MRKSAGAAGPVAFCQGRGPASREQRLYGLRCVLQARPSGHSAKTVLTDEGGLDLAVPRERNTTFEPVLVPRGRGVSRFLRPYRVAIRATLLEVRPRVRDRRRRLGGEEHRHLLVPIGEALPPPCLQRRSSPHARPGGASACPGRSGTGPVPERVTVSGGDQKIRKNVKIHDNYMNLWRQDTIWTESFCIIRRLNSMAVFALSEVAAKRIGRTYRTSNARNCLLPVLGIVSHSG